jgi:cytochrome c oxidase subunit 2
VADTREQYANLAAVYGPIAVGVFALMIAMIVVFALRYRSDDDRPVGGRSKATGAESLYALGLACVAAGLAYITFSTMADLEAGVPSGQSPAGEVAAAGPPALEVTVTAARWNWRFDYPRYGITQVGSGTRLPTLVVPTGHVRFAVTSVDVVHSFFIPEERYKRDAFPERYNRFGLRFERPGFRRGGGKCAEYCGLRHSYMNFDVRVLDRASFERWAQAQRAAAGGARPPA